MTRKTIVLSWMFLRKMKIEKLRENRERLTISWPDPASVKGKSGPVTC